MKENGNKVIEISRLLEIPESKCRSVLKVFHQRGSVEMARRTERSSKVSKRGEARLLRIVRESRGNVLKDITTDFNNGIKVNTLMNVL